VYGVSFLAVNVHVITTSFAGILKSAHGFHTKSYHGTLTLSAIVTNCSYLYPLVAGRALAHVTSLTYSYETL
jgi:hypothetical protein